MFPNNLTRAEAQDRAALIESECYAIEIDLSGRSVSEPDEQFRSTVTLTFTARAAGSTHLDLIADAVTEAVLDGDALEIGSFQNSRLPLQLRAGQHQLTVTAICRYSRSGEGLHRFIDPVDGRTYLYTQFEASEARRVFGCFEQPDLKARFAVSVIAPEAWTIVSNGSVVDKTPAGDGSVRTRFTETLPISTYLTALIAGDYAAVHDSYDGAAGTIPMALLCRQSLAEHLDAERLFEITAEGFSTFEKHFDFPYPFGKYDQIFVPEYNGGAMENIGCVTLRDEYIFRSKVADATVEDRRDTMLHELSHMWFGDLVTMRWWDDLWLKESFATWASTFAVSQHVPDPSVPWAAFTNTSKTMAYRQDQLPSTHPIAADIVDLEAVEYNFDQITYAKGASVLIQLVAFVGLEAFLAGVRDYFRVHAYGNTTLDDLLQSLERTSGRDLSDWSRQWLETAGVNTLRLDVEVDHDGSISSARLLQEAPENLPTLRQHRIAFGVYEQRNGKLVRTQRIERDVDGPGTPIDELVGLRAAAIVVNDDDLTYAKVRTDPRSLATLLTELPAIESSVSRAVVWGSFWDACRDAEFPAADYADLVLRRVSSESGSTAVRAMLGQAGIAAFGYTSLTHRDEVTSRWRQGLHDLLTAAPAGSDLQLALARSFAGAADPGWSADLLTDWLVGSRVPDGLTIDTDLRWLLVNNLARLGMIDESGIAAEEQRDSSITGAEKAAGARAARPTAEAKAEAWRLAVEEDALTNSAQAAVCLNLWQRGQDDVLLPYVDRYFQAVEDISAVRGVWATKGISLRKNVLRNLFPWPLDKRTFLDRLDTWLAGVELSPTTSRAIMERRDDALRALRCQEAFR
jgi:aminopeptidase N